MNYTASQLAKLAGAVCAHCTPMTRVEHSGFRAFFDKMHPQLAAVMRAAAEVYVTERAGA